MEFWIVVNGRRCAVTPLIRFFRRRDGSITLQQRVLGPPAVVGGPMYDTWIDVEAVDEPPLGTADKPKEAA